MNARDSAVIYRATIDLIPLIFEEARRCPRCKGTGQVEGRFGREDCGACKATGDLEVYAEAPTGEHEVPKFDLLPPPELPPIRKLQNK